MMCMGWIAAVFRNDVAIRPFALTNMSPILYNLADPDCLNFWPHINHAKMSMIFFLEDPYHAPTQTH